MLQGKTRLSLWGALLTVTCILQCKPTARTQVQSIAHTRAPTVLWLAGDTHFGDSHSPLFSQHPESLNGAIGIVNLEGPVRAAATDVSEQHLRTSAHALQTLIAAGVQVVSIANNHRLDDGVEGYTETQRLIRSAGLRVAGVDPAPTVLHTPNGTVGILALDLSSQDPIDPNTITAQVARSKRECDWTVVAFHTSGAALYRPSERLRLAAESALTAGASIVVAHGTHTVAPVERRNNAVIAWGLGNLLFNCDCSLETEGIVLRVELRAGQPIGAAVIPIQAGIHGQSAQVAGPEGANFALFAAMGGAPLVVDGGLGSF